MTTLTTSKLQQQYRPGPDAQAHRKLAVSSTPLFFSRFLVRLLLMKGCSLVRMRRARRESSEAADAGAAGVGTAAAEPKPSLRFGREVPQTA